MVKNPPANAGDTRDMGLISGLGSFPGEGNGSPPTPVFLPGKSQGRRSPVGYSPWGLKESDGQLRTAQTKSVSLLPASLATPTGRN